MPVLSDAPFYLRPITSLILQNGSGNPALTRATAKTFFDNEGILKTVPAGGALFGGARSIRNVFSGSGDMYNSASWVTVNQSKAPALDPSGNSGAVLCTVSSNATNSLQQAVTANTVAGNTRTLKLLYKPGTAAWQRMLLYAGSTDRVTVWFNTLTNTIGTISTGGTGWAHVSSSLTASVTYPGWYELYVIYTCPANAAGAHYVQIITVDANNSSATTAVSGMYITWAFPQLEDSTGRADKTPSEYLATGVLSAPYYGAGIDGLKYYATNKDGSAIPESILKGLNLNSAAVTNTALWCRDFTNAAWVKTNVTAALTQTGIDGQANACSLLTAGAANGTALQSITAAASAGCSGFYIKRSAGVGSVYITRDGGTNWTDITSLINSGTFTLVKIENTSVLNPQVGIKIATSGDAVIVDYGINHLGTEIASPILTTSAAVTVNAETLTYQISGNFSDAAGTMIATVERGNWANNNGVVVGKSGSGLSTSSSNSGVQALDGTNTVNGPTGSTATKRKIGMKWSGSSMKTFAGGNFGASGSYDGSFNLTTIAIMPQSNGYISDVAIWPTELSDADMLAVASEQSDFSASVSFATAVYANVIYSVSASMPLSFDMAVNANVIHSVSSVMDINFTAAMHANVIHSVSADMGVTFGADFDSTWIALAFHISSAYAPPSITATYN